VAFVRGGGRSRAWWCVFGVWKGEKEKGDQLQNRKMLKEGLEGGANFGSGARPLERTSKNKIGKDQPIRHPRCLIGERGECPCGRPQ